MSEFEIATIPLGFILGLGVALVLTSFSAAVRDRQSHPLNWMPLSWGFMILALQIQFWFGLYDLDLALGVWSWIWYGQALVVAVLIFLAGALILPTREVRVPGGLIEDFDLHGRLALLPVAGYLVGWLVPNAKMNGSMFILPNLMNVLLAGLAIVAFVAGRRPLRTWVTVGFALLLTYTMVFVYSTPGPDPMP